IYALSEGRQPMVNNLYEKFETTLKLINDEVPDDSLYQVHATPTDITLPEAWMLGSTGNSALQTARMGVGYSFAQFFNGELSKEIVDIYKTHFRPSAFMKKPDIIVAYLVTVCETKEEAEFEALPYDISRLWLQKGRMIQPM